VYNLSRFMRMPGAVANPVLYSFFLLLVLWLSASAAPAWAARAECQGFGGSKACVLPDINTPKGPYIEGLNQYNACERIGAPGKMANNGGTTFAVVAESGTQGPAVYVPAFTAPYFYISNYCTAMATNRKLYYPRLEESGARCTSGYSMDVSAIPYLCVPNTIDPAKNLGKNCCDVMTGNPIHHGTGNKFQHEVDYISAAGLSFERYYNSFSIVNSSGNTDLASNWRHSYMYSVKVSPLTNTMATAYRPDGKAYAFRSQTPLSPDGIWSADGDVVLSLTRTFGGDGLPSGWKITRNDGAREVYNADGIVVSIRYPSGKFIEFEYSGAETPPAIAAASGLLIAVRDNFGRELRFEYDAKKRLCKMVDPAGNEYLYKYNEASSIVLDGRGDVLTSVVFPDGNRKIYWYNEQENTSGINWPTALTGISDEKAVRFATFKYNGSFLATTTLHAGNVDKHTVEYYVPGTLIYVTDPLGVKRAQRLSVAAQTIFNAGADQAGAFTSGYQTITYDANGNPKLRTNFLNAKTSYVFDLSRNLETQRIEGFGTSSARTVTTQWHPTLALVSHMAEPKRITTYTYDENGNRLTKSVQATTDANGSLGFSAPSTGPARLQSWTYNDFGQVLTARGARTDVDDLTTYVYDGSGNLTSVTDAANHVTSLSDYDAHGNVGVIVDPNGLRTELTYTIRGWMSSSSVGGETTSYAYDAVGQLIKTTMPDGSSISYSYDPAHRLTAVADNAGNSITYTLDNMGNRIGEQVKDAAGTLSRKISRAYNPLNKLKTVTGAAQ